MPALSRLMKLLLCLALGAGLATAAYAAEDDDTDRLDEAWEDAIGDQEPILTEKQFAMLNNLAFQAAASKVCDGFALDHDKFTAGMTEAVSPPPPDLTEEEADHWEAAVLVRFGTTYGLLLAEGNNEPEEFCASAAEFKADSELPNVWQ
jgi:hypothetical protein